MSGWCFANVLKLSARERFFCLLVSGVPDLDAISRVFGEDAYWDYHHVVGHNLLVGLVVSAVLTCFSQHRLKAMLVYLGLYHLHLVMDYYGSGPLWEIAYLWPLWDWKIVSLNSWAFHSWQNISTAIFFLLWTLAIIVLKKRTPLEWPMPSLDRQLVELAEKWKRGLCGRKRA